MDNVEFITKNIVGSYLISFGLVSQFLELRFSSHHFHKIIINLDCKLETSDLSYNKEVESFKKYCSDAYEIAYFIRLNLKKVTNCTIFENKDLIVFEFEEGLDLIFKLTDPVSDFSITFWDKSNPKFYDSFHIASGKIEKGNPL